MFTKFFIIFFFSSVFASSNPKTVIVHMPGNADGGLDFLNPELLENGFFDIKSRYSNTLNPKKDIHIYNDKLFERFIYTNNIALNDMDLGGPNCVEFYKKMILEVNKLFPDAEIILAGASQGSVGPFGALAKLAEENNPVVSKIKKVLIEAALGSTHETINFYVKKIPLLKILPYFSKKIGPLLAEYLPRFIPGFAAYDAFAPQMYHYIDTITHNSELLKDIKFYIIHDLYDDIIPYQCAENVHSLLPKNQAYFKLTKNEGHLPAYYHQSEIISFLNGKNLENEIDRGIMPSADHWHLKAPSERFLIRRIRDFTVLATLFISYQSIKYLIGSIVKILKNRY